MAFGGRLDFYATFNAGPFVAGLNRAASLAKAKAAEIAGAFRAAGTSMQGSMAAATSGMAAGMAQITANQGAMLSVIQSNTMALHAQGVAGAKAGASVAAGASKAAKATTALGVTAKTTTTAVGAGLTGLNAKLALFSKHMVKVNNQFLGLSMIGRRAFLGLAIVIGVAVAASARFVRQMAEVSTMIEEWNLRFVPGMAAGVKGLAIEFGQTTRALTQNLYDILSASIAPDKAMGVLRDSAISAAAGFTETNIAGRAMISVLKAYNLEATKSGRVSDFLFNVVRRGRVTYEQLASNIGIVTAIAARAGISMEELGGTIATATRVGLPLEQTLTGVRATVNMFTGAADDAKNMAKKYGFELTVAGLRAEGLSRIIAKLSMATEDDIKVMFKNIRSRQLLYSLLRDTTGLLEDVDFWMRRSGTAMEAFGKATDTIAFQFQQLKQAAINVGIALGDMFTAGGKGFGFISTLAKVLTGLSQTISAIPAPIKAVVGLLGIFALAISGVIAVMGIFTAIAAGLTIAFGGLGAAVIAAMPWLLGLSALALVAYEVGRAWQESTKTVKASLRDQVDEISKVKFQLEDEVSTIERLMDRYHKLSSVIDNTNTSVKARKQAEEELVSVMNSMVNIMPVIRQGITDEGNARAINVALLEKELKLKKEKLKLEETKEITAKRKLVQGFRDEGEEWRKNSELLQNVLGVFDRLNREAGEGGVSLVEAMKEVAREYAVMADGVTVDTEKLGVIIKSLDDEFLSVGFQNFIVGTKLGQKSVNDFGAALSEMMILSNALTKVINFTAIGEGLDLFGIGPKLISDQQGFNDVLNTTRERFIKITGNLQSAQKEVANFDAIQKKFAGGFEDIPFEKWFAGLEDAEKEFFKRLAKPEDLTDEMSVFFLKEGEDMGKGFWKDGFSPAFIKGGQDLLKKHAEIMDELGEVSAGQRKLMTDSIWEENQAVEELIDALQKEITTAKSVGASKLEVLRLTQELVEAEEKLAAAEDKQTRNKQKLTNARLNASKALNKSAKEEVRTWQQIENEINNASIALSFLTKFSKDYALISDATKQLNSLLKEQSGNINDVGDEYGDMYNRLQRDASASASTILALIDSEMAKHEQNTTRYKALQELRIDYTQQSASEIVQIWGSVNDSIKGGLSTFIADIAKGNSTLSESFKNLGNTIKNAFIDAFAKSLVKKSGFDLILEKNIFGIGNLFGGLGGKIISGVGGAMDETSSLVAKTWDDIIANSEDKVDAFKKFSKMGGTTLALDGETFFDFSEIPGIKETGEAAEYTAAELANLGGEIDGVSVSATKAAGPLSGIGSAISSVVPFIAAAAVSISGWTDGVKKLEKGFRGGRDSATNMTKGVIRMVAPATVLGEVFGEVTSEVVDSMALVAGLGPVLGTLAAGIGIFGEKLGIIKHGISWKEEYGKQLMEYKDFTENLGQDYAEFYKKLEATSKEHYDKELELLSMNAIQRHELYEKIRADEELLKEFEGTDWSEVEINLKRHTQVQEKTFRTLYTRLTNFSNDYWGKEHSMLEEAFVERFKFYQEQVKLGIFTTEQLKMIWDSLQLGTTAADRSEQARLTTSRAALDTWYDHLWKTFANARHLHDDLAGTGEAFQRAYERSLDGSIDMMTAFEDELRQMGITGGELFDKLMESTREAVASENFGVLMESMSDGFRDLAANVAFSLKESGDSVGTFSNDLTRLVRDFLTDAEEMDFGLLVENLRNMPGITQEVAEDMADELLKLRQAEITELPGLDAWLAKITEIMGKSGEEIRKMIDPSRLLDESVLQSYYDWGNKAGQLYKEGFEAGASGSGILGDVLWDDSVMADAARRYEKFGEDVGMGYKEGFEKEAKKLGTIFDESEVKVTKLGLLLDKGMSEGGGSVIDSMKKMLGMFGGEGSRPVAPTLTSEIPIDFGPMMESIRSFVSEMGLSEDGLNDLNTRQAELLLEKMELDSEKLAQEKIMGKTSSEVVFELLKMLGSVRRGSDDFEKLTDEQRAYLEKLEGFTFEDHIEQFSNWGEFIDRAVLGDYVEEFDLGDKVQDLYWYDYVTDLSDWHEFITPVNLADYINPVPGAQRGLDYARKGTYLVGERGPELVNLPQGAGVTPNNELGVLDVGGIGGRQVTIENITVNTGPITADSDYNTIGKKITDSIRSSLREAR